MEDPGRIFRLRVGPERVADTGAFRELASIFAKKKYTRIAGSASCTRIPGIVFKALRMTPLKD